MAEKTRFSEVFEIISYGNIGVPECGAPVFQVSAENVFLFYFSCKFRISDVFERRMRLRGAGKSVATDEEKREEKSI